MGSPVSSITAETFLQYYEQMIITHRLETNTLLLYTYVDDILILTREKQQKKTFFVKLNNPTETRNFN
jgi:hypothetical protein